MVEELDGYLTATHGAASVLVGNTLTVDNRQNGYKRAVRWVVHVPDNERTVVSHCTGPHASYTVHIERIRARLLFSAFLFVCDARGVGCDRVCSCAHAQHSGRP